MKKLFISQLVLAAFALLFIGSCKKEKTTEIYFTQSSASAERGDVSTVVKIELSEASNDVVEVDLQSIGSGPIRFGAYDQVFLRDDSEKCEVTIDAHAFIDTAGHIKIASGVKSVSVTFTPQYDNFPHAAVTYQLKMVSAKNATVRAGSDVFTYSIASANVVNVFNSSLSYNGLEHDSLRVNDSTLNDVMVHKSGVFSLQSTDFSKNGQGSYDLILRYKVESGDTKVTTLSFTYNNIPYFSIDSNHLNCNNSSLKIEFNAPDIYGIPSLVNQVLDCGSITAANTTLNVQVSPTPSPVYGDYNTFTGYVDIHNADYSFAGSLNSPFFWLR